MNKHFERQVKRYLGSLDKLPSHLHQLFEAISQHYDDNDNHRKMLEHIIDASSTEMLGLNDKLREDIARRKTVEEELRVSQQRYQTFIAQSSEGISRYEIEPISPDLPVEIQIEYLYNAVIAECNDGFAIMYGYDNAEELTGLRLKDILPPNEQNDNYLHGFINRQYHIREVETLEKDRYGANKCFLNSLDGVLENGKLVQCWRIQRDITEWKVARERIETSEAHLKASQRIAKIGSWELDLVDTVNVNANSLRWSDETFKMFGYKPGSIAVTNDFFFNAVFPDDRELVSQAFAKALKTNGVYSIEHRIILPDNTIKTVHEIGEIEVDPATGKQVKMIGTVQDVTEWKSIQEKISLSQLDLNTSQRIAKVGSWMIETEDITNPETYKVHWSAETYRIFGLEPQAELHSDTFFSMVHPDDRKIVEEAFFNAIGTGIMNHEHRIITAQGNERTVTERAEVIFNPKTGLPIKVLGTTQDITEQKMAELSLKNTEANLRTILENTDTAYNLLDKQGRVLSFNHLADELAIKEKGRGFIAGESYLNWMSDDRKELVADYLDKVVNEKAKLQYEVSYGEHDGNENWLYVRMYPILNEDDEVLGISVSATNITERKKAEQIIKQANERYTMATKATNDIIWDWDIINNYFYRSENYGQVFGYPINKDNIYFTDWVSNIHPEDRERISQSVFEKINDPGATKWEDEYRYYRNNGEIAYIQDKAFILHDENNRPVRMVGAMQDITAKKLAELELKKITTDLIQRNKDLEQFAYIVSHNLRAPVANIIGFSEILKQDSLKSEEKQEFISGLATSVKKLDDVIMDLNHILQVKREVNELRERVKFSELTDDIILSIKSSVEKEQVEIKMDFSEVDEIVTLKSYMYSIFYNLISNSIKYRQPDVKPVIEISSSIAKNKISIVFKDNGLGIDMQRKGHQVFGLYKRFHKHSEGKGMGLFMVKTQVETLGGKISVKSEVNKGSEFNIEFET